MPNRRKIPATMVTQHPDHANAPYWHDSPFISTQEEPYECYLSFSELGATEYKWDWEGKLVDEAIVERLFSTYFDYFKQNPIGIEKFITFRLPNPKVETEFRMGRAFMGILAASGLANHVGMAGHPLFEVILPMTETAREMLAIQEAFHELTMLKHPLLKLDPEDIKHIELIPLFEDIKTIANSDSILEEYLVGHKWKFGFLPKYMRPYVARSDPALNAGIVPTVLAIKIALSGYRKLSEKYSLPLYPIIGAAALPFRGGLNPLHIDSFINEYKGIRTTTIQSAFRYDFPKNKVIKALKSLESDLKRHKAELISEAEVTELLKIMVKFEHFYKSAIEKLAPLINKIAMEIPRRRERVQHVGLFGYSRGVGRVKLPRAISFTAALYSIGVPPELIGTGRGIKYLKKQNKISLLESHYKNIRTDLLNSLKYLNRDLLRILSAKYPAMKEVSEDVEEIDKYLNKAETPIREHHEISTTIYKRLNANKEISELIVSGGILRNSLG